MKRNHIFLLILSAQLIFAQASAQDFFRFTIGKETYNFTSHGYNAQRPDAPVVFYSESDEGDNHIPHHTVRVYVNLRKPSGKRKITQVGFSFYLPPGEKLQPGKYLAGNILAYKKSLPSVHFGQSEVTGSKTTDYTTMPSTKNYIEITAVTANRIEGVFHLSVHQDGLMDGSYRHAFDIAKGSFSVRMTTQ